jgi:hypothetical protein
LSKTHAAPGVTRQARATRTQSPVTGPLRSVSTQERLHTAGQGAEHRLKASPELPPSRHTARRAPPHCLPPTTKHSNTRHNTTTHTQLIESIFASIRCIRFPSWDRLAGAGWTGQLHEGLALSPGRAGGRLQCGCPGWRPLLGNAAAPAACGGAVARGHQRHRRRCTRRSTTTSTASAPWPHQHTQQRCCMQGASGRTAWRSGG